MKLKLRSMEESKDVHSEKIGNLKLKLAKLLEKQEKIKQFISTKYSEDTCVDNLDKLWAYAVFENPKVKNRIIKRFTAANRIHLWEFDRANRRCSF